MKPETVIAVCFTTLIFIIALAPTAQAQDESEPPVEAADTTDEAPKPDAPEPVVEAKVEAKPEAEAEAEPGLPPLPTGPKLVVILGAKPRDYPLARRAELRVTDAMARHKDVTTLYSSMLRRHTSFRNDIGLAGCALNSVCRERLEEDHGIDVFLVGDVRSTPTDYTMRLVLYRGGEAIREAVVTSPLADGEAQFVALTQRTAQNLDIKPPAPVTVAPAPISDPSFGVLGLTGLASTSIGLAAAILSLYFRFQFESHNDALIGEASNEISTDDRGRVLDLHRDVSRDADLTSLLFSVSAGGLAIGATLIALECLYHGDESVDPEEATAAKITPIITGDGGGAAIQLSFESRSGTMSGALSVRFVRSFLFLETNPTMTEAADLYTNKMGRVLVLAPAPHGRLQHMIEERNVVLSRGGSITRAASRWIFADVPMNTLEDDWGNRFDHQVHTLLAGTFAEGESLISDLKREGVIVATEDEFFVPLQTLDPNDRESSDALRTRFARGFAVARRDRPTVRGLVTSIRDSIVVG